MAKTNYPHTFIEFMKRFHNEDACRQYLLEIKWENGFLCSACGHDQYWAADNFTRCVCRKCDRKINVCAGTILQDAKLSAQIWLTAMWLFATQKDGISAKNLQENLGLQSYKSAWLLLHKLRVAMVRSGREPLSGIIEIDEGYIGGEFRRRKKR